MQFEEDKSEKHRSGVIQEKLTDISVAFCQFFFTFANQISLNVPDTRLFSTTIRMNEKCTC